MTYKYTKYNCN